MSTQKLYKNLLLIAPAGLVRLTRGVVHPKIYS